MTEISKELIWDFNLKSRRNLWNFLSFEQNFGLIFIKFLIEELS